MNPLTASEIAALVNREGLATIPMRGKNNDNAVMGAFRVRVRILDVAQSYGRTRVKVEPMAGDGAAWINKESVEVGK